MDQWLIRTSQNWIAGPYPKEKVRQMILEGKLTFQDEVCLANGYWLYLHEREEIRQLLDVEVPEVLYQLPDEVTATLILPGTSVPPDQEDTDPELDAAHEQMYDELGRVAASQSTSETTAVLSTDALRNLGSAGSTKGAPKQVSEAHSFWRGFAWFLVVGSFLLIVIIFRWKRH